MKKKQEVIDTRNELSKCVDYFKTLNSRPEPQPQSFIPTNKSNIFQITAGVLKIDNSNNVDDATIIAYCQGTGTIDGNTFQENLNEGNWFSDKILTELKNLNVIFLKKGILSSYSTYKATPNPEMKNQTYSADNRK